jgi:hypothetical protein
MRNELAPPLRPARLSDAERLAELVSYAGEGLPCGTRLKPGVLSRCQ